MNGLPCTPSASDSAHRKIHLRGLHYMLVSGEVAKPDGLPYTNTEEDWTWLVMHAAKAARWLGYIPFDQIVDARNAEPVINVREPKPELPPQPWISVGLDVEVPDAVDLEPYVYVDRFRVDQPYRLVFFGEKTSLDEILSPVARECERRSLPARRRDLRHHAPPDGRGRRRGRSADGGVVLLGLRSERLADADLASAASSRRSRRCCSPISSSRCAGSR